MPKRLLKLASCRYRQGRCITPRAKTMRRLASTIDADTADALLNAWPRHCLMPTNTAPTSTNTAADGETSQPEGDQAPPKWIGLAIDGKTVHGQRPTPPAW